MTYGARICLISYVEKALDAERRLRKGERQHQCRKCLRWWWADEMKAHKCEGP